MNAQVIPILEADRETIIKNISNKEGVAENTVITANILDDGSYKILSRFGDDKWIFPNSLFPAGVKEGTRCIKFDRLTDKAHVLPLKVALAKFYLAGMPGKKRPRGATLIEFNCHCVSFLNYLAKTGISGIEMVNPLVGSQYVIHAKKLPGRSPDSIASTKTLLNKFSGVEILYHLLRDTKYSFSHPWPESSSSILSQWQQEISGKTEIIPDLIAKDIMQASNDLLNKSDQMHALSKEINCLRGARNEYSQIGKKLSSAGYTDGIRGFRSDIESLRDSCMVIILMVTGIRVHELASLESNCIYSKSDEEGNRQYWIRGVSTKTGEGATEWLAPEIALKAIRILEWVAEPLQIELKNRLNSNESYNDENTSISSLFLAKVTSKNNRIETLSLKRINLRLKAYVRSIGVDWDFSSHQCRRTFASFIVHNALGDLRYLRDHFKHWSIDMTAMYAANQAQDRDLYDEIYLAMVDQKKGKITHWLDPETPIAGGMGDKIKIFRSQGEPVRTYASRSEMIDGVSDTISIRATGVAWCTADLGGCNGGNGADRTKCGDCDGSIIDDKLKTRWEAIYAQQIELLNLDDIGEPGKITARRALARCEKVLTDLGADLDRIKEAVNA